MLPPDLVDLSKRLDKAIKKHKVEPLRDAIADVAEPQVLVFEKSGAGGNATLGELHETARKIDPSIPADFDKAMRKPGLEAIERLVQQRAHTLLEPGGSRVGGTPDLPPDLAWPTHDGKHLTFIAQLDLASLPRWKDSPLPATGWLWAFAGGDFPLASAVLHWEGERSALTRRATPPADAMLSGEFVDKPEYNLIPLEGGEVVASIPGYGSPWWDEHVGSDDDGLVDRTMELVEALGSPSKSRDGGAVSVLGLMAMQENSPTELAVEWGEKKGGTDWRLLLEVGSIGSMNWSDSGYLAFLIRESALAKGDFSDTYAVVSSS